MDDRIHNPQEADTCQGPRTVDLSLSDLVQSDAALWNSAVGRRAFLKKTGAATVATAVALHGFRVQVQAQTTPLPPWKPKFRDYTQTIYYAGLDDNAQPIWTTDLGSAMALTSPPATIPAAPASPTLTPGNPPTNVNMGVWGALNITLMKDVRTNAPLKQGFPKFNPGPNMAAPQAHEITLPNGQKKMGYKLEIKLIWEYTDGS